MASLTRWTWVWVNSGSWWWTGRPGVLRFMGSQRVGHNWATDLIWCDLAAAYGIQFPDQGSNLGPLHWEHRPLASGPPGKSTFKSADSEYSRLPSIMWLGLIQTVEGLKRKMCKDSRLPLDLGAATSTLPWVTSQLHFGHANLHNHTSRFLKLSPSVLSLSQRLTVVTFSFRYIHKSYWVSGWRTLIICPQALSSIIII